MDRTKDKIGYEINFNRHFYRYTPPARSKKSTPTSEGRGGNPAAPQGGNDMKPRRPSSRSIAKAVPAKTAAPLLAEVRELILAARTQVAQTVNAGLTFLYWQVGGRIRREILNEKRAEYGQEILRTLSAQLTAEFGRGFSEKSLRHMVRLPRRSPISRLSQHC